MNVQEYFLLDKFIEDYRKKHREHISVEKIAGECGVTVSTVKNWADPTMGGIPSITKSGKLCDLLGERLDIFAVEYFRTKVILSSKNNL